MFEFTLVCVCLLDVLLFMLSTDYFIISKNGKGISAVKKKSVIYIFKTVNQYAIYVDVVVNKNKQYPCFLRVTVKSETELDCTRRANPDGLTAEAALDGEPNGTWPEGGRGSCGCSEWLRSPGHLVGERTEWREEGRTARLRLRLGS